MDDRTEAALDAFATELRQLGWIRALLVGGSLATGDHVPGVSDLDLVAVVDGPADADRVTSLTAVHRALDAGLAHGMDLGCQYVDLARLHLEHPTWTHGGLVRRTVSLVTRAELVLHGWSVFGPAPTELFPPVTPDDVRAAARAEVLGYWAWAARRPLMWRHPVIADLGLTGMARARHSLATGELLTKSAAIEQAAAPEWLRDQLRARRRDEDVSSPPWRTAWIAWRDARRTVRLARRS